METKKVTLRKFAKLFETEEHGQILVRTFYDEADDGSDIEGIILSFDLGIEGLAPTEIKVTSKTEGKAFELLDSITRDAVVSAVNKVKELTIN